MQDWIEHKDESEGTRQRAEKLKSALAELGSEFDSIQASRSICQTYSMDDWWRWLGL
jgi:hypothetical protein